MGLDISPGNARWSYHGFDAFRQRLARQEGIDLERLWDERPLEHGGNWFIPWRQEEDPLLLLLNHSDCDGGLTASECLWLLPRLVQTVRGWPLEDYDREQAFRLAAGCLECVRTGERLEFG